MKVVIDNQIPFIREAADSLFEQVVYLPGADITASDVSDADALIIRTRTKCNRDLLEHSNIKFIATATIGFDHLDTAFLKEAGIAWSNCPGCNAHSVGQYVRSSLLLLKRELLLQPETATVGIVGAGHVGTAVAEALRPFGCRILLNDPPRQISEKGEFYPLEELAEVCDVITFHTPFTRSGPFPTFHLAGDSFFQTLKKQPILINAARGGVVDETALLQAMDKKLIKAAIIDTWENEPRISSELLRKAFIATPHIAGYSSDGKANATRMALDAVCEHFGISRKISIIPPVLPSSMRPSQDTEEQALQLYNPSTDSDALKANPEAFEQLRNHYHLRREVWDFGKDR